MKTPWDSDTIYRIECAEPDDPDGYRNGEPKWLVCDECGARELLTEAPSAGVDGLGHNRPCDQRWAKSNWWRERFEAE